MSGDNTHGTSGRLLRSRLALNALAALVALAGCEAGRDAADTATTASATTPTAPDTAGAAEVSVMLTEWRVELPQDTVAPGVTTFHAMNRGEYVHALEVEGGGREWKSEQIKPGGMAMLRTDLTGNVRGLLPHRRLARAAPR